MMIIIITIVVSSSSSNDDDDDDDDGYYPNSQLQISTNSSNSHQRSISYNDARNLEIPALHQKSNSVDSHYIDPSQDSNYLSPTPLISNSSTNYQRIMYLSKDDDSDNNNIAVPIISPMLSPRIVPKSPSILSSDSDSDVSVSSSDDTSESDSDTGDHSFSPNSLQKQLLKDLSNVQISTIEKSTISNENNSVLPTPKTKKLKRIPTTGRGLV